MAANHHTKSGKGTRHRALWIWVIIAVLGALALLIAALPTLLSTGPFRRAILDEVNTRIPGTAHVARWSLGWFRGVDIHNLTFENDQGTTELDVRRIVAKPHVGSFLRGRGSLGRTVIDRPVVKIKVPPPVQTTGGTGSGTASTPPSGVLPVYAADIQVRDGVLEIQDRDRQVSTFSDINSEITLDPQRSRVVLAAVVPGSGPDAPGAVAAQVAVDHPGGQTWNFQDTSGQWSIDVNGLDLSSLEGLMELAQVDVNLAGLGYAKVQGRIDRGQVTQLDGRVRSETLAVSGPALQGDRFSTPQLVMTMDVFRQGDAIRVNTLSMDGDWFTAECQGTLPVASGDTYRLTGDARVDVATLAAQLPATLSVREGARITRGEAAGHFDISNAQVSADVRLDKLTGQLNGTTVGLSAPIEGQLRLDTAQDVYRIETLKVTSSFAGVDASGDTQRVTFSNWVDLGRMQSEFGQFLNTGPYTLKGRFSSDGVVQLAQARIDVSATAQCKNFLIADQQGRSVAEPNMSANCRLSYDRAQDLIQVAAFDWQTGAGRLGLAPSQVNLRNDTIDAGITARAVDLERVQAYADLFNVLPQGMTLKGRAQSTLQCHKAGPQIQVTTDQTRIRDLELAMPDKTPFKQDTVSLAFVVGFDTLKKSIDIASLQLTSPQIKITKSEFHRSATGDQVNVSGAVACDYDLQAVAGAVSTLLPEGLAMTGHRTGTLDFASHYPEGEPNQVFVNASGSARFGFEQARYMGLEFAATDLKTTFKDGILAIEPFSTTVNQGQFSFAARTDFRRKPVVMTLPAPMTIAQRIQLNRETTERLFKYVNPLFADLSAVSGSVNFACDRLVVPLDPNAVDKLQLAGTLSMDEVYLQGSPLLDKILSGLQARPVNAQEIIMKPTRLTVQDGWVQYDDMPLIVGDNPLNFSGRIGLDERLDMRVLLPYTTAGRTARVGQAYAGDRVSVDLGGTLGNPQIDMAGILQQLFKFGIQRGLEELFKH